MPDGSDVDFEPQGIGVEGVISEMGALAHLREEGVSYENLLLGIGHRWGVGAAEAARNIDRALQAGVLVRSITDSNFHVTGEKKMKKKEDTTRKTIYRFRNGSHMYGLNTPNSDVDYMEVFLPAPEDVLGLRQVEVIDASTKASSESRRNEEGDVDDNRYTLQRYLDLLLANNPNILETLFAPKDVIEVCDPVLKPILSHPEKIVCKKCYKTFNGYAKSQEHKLLEKKARYEELVAATAMLEKVYGDILGDPTAAMDDGLAAKLNATLKHYRGQKHHDESFHEGLPVKIIYEKMKEERDTYGWRVKTKTFETLGYCVKFGYHLLRLYYEAHSLLQTGRVSFPFVGTEYETLMAIKTGQVSLETLMELCKEARFEADLSYTLTDLPEEPDREFVNDYLIKTTLEHFRG